MIRLLVNEFNKNEYKELIYYNKNEQIANQSNPICMYQLRDEGVYIIAFWEDCKISADDCDLLSRQVKWSFINQGYRNVQLLHIIINSAVNEVKHLINDVDCYWFINKDTNQLIIYENQKSNFLNARTIVETALNPKKEYNIKSNYYRVKATNNLITVGLISINIIIFLVMDWSFDGSLYNKFIENGGISYQTAVTNHQYYRLISHMFIHGGMDHLFGNMIVLYFLGSQLENKIGRIQYIVLYFVGGIVAAIASLGYNSIHDSLTLSVGASGAIFAVVGAMVSIVIFDKEAFKELGIGRLIFFVILTVGNGLTTTGIDNAAHIGGLIFGSLVGYFNFRINRKSSQRM